MISTCTHLALPTSGSLNQMKAIWWWPKPENMCINFPHWVAIYNTKNGSTKNTLLAMYLNAISCPPKNGCWHLHSGNYNVLWKKMFEIWGPSCWCQIWPIIVAVGWIQVLTLHLLIWTVLHINRSLHKWFQFWSRDFLVDPFLNILIKWFVFESVSTNDDRMVIYLV